MARKAHIIYEGPKAWNGIYRDGKGHFEIRTGQLGKGKLVYHRAWPGLEWYHSGLDDAHTWAEANGYDVM